MFQLIIMTGYVHLIQWNKYLKPDNQIKDLKLAFNTKKQELYFNWSLYLYEEFKRTENVQGWKAFCPSLKTFNIRQAFSSTCGIMEYWSVLLSFKEITDQEC